MPNQTGDTYGTRQGSDVTVHSFPVAFNTTGIGSAVNTGIIIKASADKPVSVMAFLRVVTAFNAVTTNVVTVGTTTSANEWITAAAANESLIGRYPSDATNVIAFAGKNGTGAITATGLAVGDRITSVTGVASGTVGDQSAAFESVVSVADQIQQLSASNLSANIYMATVQKAASVNGFRLTADTPIYAKYTQSGTAATTGAAVVEIWEFQENTRAIA